MKLQTSFDLSDKIIEAEKGYSLKKCIKKGLCYTGINAFIGTAINLSLSAPPDKYLRDLAIYITWHATSIGLATTLCKDTSKVLSQYQIANLSSQLRDINVNASFDELMASYTYKTEYETNLKNPFIEQKKYINVPVNDVWGEREVSLCQEHILGTNEWALSIGTPREEKVYTLGLSRAPNK